MNAIVAFLQNLIQQAANRTDLVLAVLLVNVIFMMVLPLPTALVDTFIAINISISAILLMVSMYLVSPLAFSAFPTVLLITTLFRLALSISTTRLILLQGDAGHIIQTFGNFVVGGNLVVGLVVFLILTIVQFIVITKGAERVAEVGARFSLDAMPGKQMSIDGDMRAGVIDVEQARLRRSLLEKESQLYGAMDGAMKFVKGDAIAGIIIVAVNLVGGMLIGILQRDMTASEAINVYSLLTIGDGLVSQVPALFISITAGIIVTRVANEDGFANVGKEIGSQLLAQPKALLIGGTIMLGFAIVPGMPTLIFLVLALFIGGIGLVLMRKNVRAGGSSDGEFSVDNVPAMAASSPKSAAGRGDGGDFAPIIPLMIDISEVLQTTFKPEQLNEELIKIRRALYYDLGVPFPGIHLRYNRTLAKESYNILINEIPVSQGHLKPGYLFVQESEENLKIFAIAYQSGPRILPNTETLWCEETLSDVLKKANIRALEPTQVLTNHLAYVLKKYAADFIGIQELRFLFNAMESTHAELVKELQRILPIQRITEILQRLVSEGVSIRNLRTIFETLIEWGQKEKDSVLLTEYTRLGLKRQISSKYCDANNILPAYLLSSSIEDSIRAAVRQTSSGSYLELDPETSKRIINSIKRTVGKINTQGNKAVLLTYMDIRRYVRKLIEQELYDLAVLSFQELTPEHNIQPLARVEIL